MLFSDLTSLYNITKMRNLEGHQGIKEAGQSIHNMRTADAENKDDLQRLILDTVGRKGWNCTAKRQREES